MRAVVLASVACAAVMAACVPKRAQTTAAFAPCDIATGTATSYSRGTALARAERGLRTQVPDVRGDLLASGVRRVRMAGTRRTCEPYRPFGTPTGLVTCKVQARFCGR